MVQDHMSATYTHNPVPSMQQLESSSNESLKAVPNRQIPQETLPGSTAAMLLGEISATLDTGTQKAHT